MAWDGDHSLLCGVMGIRKLYCLSEIIQSYLEAHFSSHQFITIASFTDIHKNYEGFSKCQMDQESF